MDTGFLLPGESLEDDYDVSRQLLPEEVIGIMDQLLSYEMSWHQGYPLAQNLFSSLYIDHILAQSRQPNEVPRFNAADGSLSSVAGPLVHLVLMAYCIGVIKSCDIVIEMIQSQQYYEEEDFNTHTFNRNMLTDLDDDYCLKLLVEAEEWLASQSDIRTQLTEAMILRLRSRRDMYDVILPTFSATLHAEDWLDIGSRIQHLIKSHDVGKAVDEAFSSKVQRRLASTVPPRPITDLKFEDACHNLSRLCDDIKEALRISDERPVQTPEHLLVSPLIEVSRSSNNTTQQETSFCYILHMAFYQIGAIYIPRVMH
ncbi:MAG: N-alpha-acetyltransferase 35, NatC auxiliary subunit [Janthinobacterium lividum]